MRMLDADALAEAMGVKRLMIQSWEPDSAWGVPIVDAVPVVRCRECKWRPRNMGKGEYVEHLRFPWDANGEEVCPDAAGDPWYNKEPDPNGYCHLGEQEDE